MDANRGQVITTLPIGDRVDAVAFDADNKRIFTSNGEGTVSVIRQKVLMNMSLSATFKPRKGPRRWLSILNPSVCFFLRADMQARTRSQRTKSPDVTGARDFYGPGCRTTVARYPMVV
jgi:hypothetical protein